MFLIGVLATVTLMLRGLGFLGIDALDSWVIAIRGGLATMLTLTGVAHFWKLRRDNMTFRVYRGALAEENKWRAVRYGLDGKLIDFGKEEERPARELIQEMIEWFIGDVMDELGSRQEIEYAYRIMQEGTSADRQLATFRETGSLKAVVDRLVAETEEGVL